MNFDPNGFLEQLPKMGVGMLGVFMIVGIIILATYVIGAVTNKIASKKDKNK